MKGWRVEGIELGLDNAIDFFLTLPEHRQLTASPDLQFWRKAALYSLSLVAAQQVVPTLRSDEDGLYARWQTEKSEPFASLVNCMPAACRAVVEQPDTAPTARYLLTEFVDNLADCVIRESAAALRLRESHTPGGIWLTALTSGNPKLALSRAQAEKLYNDWKQWAEQSLVAGNAAFRITFRVGAPPDPEGQWTLDYLLQATDDPSLLVQAEQIWKGEAVSYLRERFDNPQERLLAGLGFAARIFPPIEHSLR